MTRYLPVAVALSLAVSAPGCAGDAERTTIHPEYDAKTGKLQVLNYDRDGDGKVDTVSRMDGSRILRIEIDTDEDGRVERWEYYDAGQALEKVGFSRANDGVEDAWAYTGPQGALERVEVSTRRDGTVSRTEHYQGDVLVRADEDTDHDRVVDKWETYEGTRLSSVAFDTLHRGRPDRRLRYAADAGVRLEVDPDGDGNFSAAP